MRPLLTLLTDFGTADGYVGELKGVLFSRVPDARVVDITHDIAPQDVDGARLVLARVWRRFPPGTVHVVVIDPGVGTARAAIAVTSDGRALVGPDNGVLSPALLAPGARAVALPVPAGAAPTFHGRDVFAPAAARLATGSALDALGAAFESPVLRRTAEVRRLADGSILGEIITIDRFGNLITNLLARHGGTVEVRGRVIPLDATSYGDVAPGALLATTGSTGLVEIAVRNGSAASLLGVPRGTGVIFRRAGA